MFPYSYYQMMWYPTPYHKELFAYGGEDVGLIWWEPMKLSRAKVSPLLASVQEEVDRWWWIWEYLPFIERVDLAWPVTFNPAWSNSSKEWDISDIYADEPIWLSIVTSRERLRLTYLIVRSVFFVINMIQYIKKRNSWKVLICLSEDNLSVATDTGSEDIIKQYRLAHLCPWYTKFEQMPWSIYESNRRLQQYLPNFPLTYVIGLAVESRLWKTSFATTREWILWWWVWYGLELFIRGVIVFVYLVLWRMWWTLYRCYEWLIRRDHPRQESLEMQWKVMVR